MRNGRPVGSLAAMFVLLAALGPGCAPSRWKRSAAEGTRFVSLAREAAEDGNMLAMSSLEYSYSVEPYLAVPWYAAIFDRPTENIPIALDDTVAAFGKRSGRVETAKDKLVHIRHQAFHVFPGEKYTFSVFLRGRGVRSAHLRIATFVSKAGGRSDADWAKAESVAVGQEELENSEGFVRVECTVDTPPDCYLIEPAITFAGPGALWFDGAQLERSPAATPYRESALDRDLERIARDHAPRSWDPNSQVTSLWPPMHAFDGKPDTYWASNDPDHSLPKDIGVSFPKPTTVRAAKVVYFNSQQRPTLVGGRWQTRDGEEWVDIVSRIVDGGSVMVYEFREPVAATALRLFVDDMKPAPEPYNKRPAIREILFDFGP